VATPIQDAARAEGGIRLPTGSTRSEWIDLQQRRPGLFRRSGGVAPDELAEVLGLRDDSHLWDLLDTEIRSGSRTQTQRGLDREFDQAAAAHARATASRLRPGAGRAAWERIKASRATVNPETTAARRWRIFSGRPVDRRILLKGVPAIGPRLSYVGEVVEVSYRVAKGSDVKPGIYRHTFTAKARAIVATVPSGRAVLLIVGAFRVGPRGIADRGQ